MTTNANLEPTGTYVLNYLAAYDVLDKEQTYLSGIAQSQLGDPSERAKSAAGAASIGIKLIEFKNAHELYMNRLIGTAKAPSDTVIAKSVTLSQNLAVDIRNAVRAAAAVDIATRFVADWTSVLQA